MYSYAGFPSVREAKGPPKFVLETASKHSLLVVMVKKEEQEDLTIGIPVGYKHTTGEMAVPLESRWPCRALPRRRRATSDESKG